VVAFYLLLAIEATSLIRSHIPRKVWRATHYLSFPLFILTTVHGLQTGRDVHTRAYEWITIIVITATMVVLIMRIVATRDSRHRRAGGVSAGHETGAELAA
jgi:DMSO/TMAO reductase YedYZ heme-binding membrane subunit